MHELQVFWIGTKQAPILQNHAFLYLGKDSFNHHLMALQRILRKLELQLKDFSDF